MKIQNFGLLHQNIAQKFGLPDQIFINNNFLHNPVEKEKLEDIVLTQHFDKEDHIIPRILLKQIEKEKENLFIIILSGIRRSGKSTILKDIYSSETYFINFDDERFINFTVDDFQTLYEVLIEQFGEKNIFIFDEIQNISGWERFVRRLHDQGKKIYITGSNATMLSKELGTHLTGRHITHTLYPFSFREFLRFHNINKINLNKLNTTEKSKIKRFFNKFVDQGGFPEYLHTKKEQYLLSLYQNILYRDIITRHHLKHEKPIKELVYYVASNIGKEISFNTLKKITGFTSATTIKEYFEYLENCFLIFLIPRYSTSLKKQIYYNKKSYVIDTALAKLLGFRVSEDKGRLLENIVFLHLKRNCEEIYFHKDKRECDFLIRKKGRISDAIQVTLTIDQHNREREIKGLLEALDHYKLKEGLILTDNQSETIIEENKTITVKPVWQWLLE